MSEFSKPAVTSENLFAIAQERLSAYDPSVPAPFKGRIPEMSEAFIKSTVTRNAAFLNLQRRIEAVGFTVNMAGIYHCHGNQMLYLPIRPKAVNTNTPTPAPAPSAGQTPTLRLIS